MAPPDKETAPGEDIVNVTLADSNLPGGLCRSLLITSDGELVVMVKSGEIRGPFLVYAGSVFPVAVLQVRLASTCTCAAIY